MKGPLVSEETIARSYEVLALLATCELALSAVRRNYVGHDTGSIAAVIGVARRVAGEVHDVIEERPTAEEGDHA